MKEIWLFKFDNSLISGDVQKWYNSNSLECFQEFLQSNDFELNTLPQSSHFKSILTLVVFN